MARYRMEDGTVVDTKNASATWEETTEWDGNNHIGAVSRSQFVRQTLYRSRRGRYYIEHYSSWQGVTPHAEWVSPQEATRWLMLCGYQVPNDLIRYVDEVSD